MNQAVSIDQVEGLPQFRKDDLKRQGIHQLADLSAYTVREVWRMISGQYENSFGQLVSAMRANSAVFRDADPNQVDLLRNDLVKLSLSTWTRNRMLQHWLRSFELIRRLRGQDLTDEV